MATNRIIDLVEQFAELERTRAALKIEAKAAGFNPGALERAASWSPERALRHQVRTAVDHQIRFHANLESEPAIIPPGSDLAKVAELAAKKMSARAIARDLGFGKTKANKLMRQAELFGVRCNADADKTDDE